MLHGHGLVQHGLGEYVRDPVQTNGIEPFWSMLKRGYVGIYHKFSQMHLDRCEREADYLAIYLLARTGIVTTDYLNF